MKSKYEIINIGKATITVDVSLVTKTEEMFFNATDMAKPFTKNVRDYIDAAQLSEIERLQIINTGLIEIGTEYQKRKKHLEKCHERGLLLLGHDNNHNGYQDVDLNRQVTA